MKNSKKHALIFLPDSILTLAVGALVLFFAGFSGLFIYIVLVLLEVTFSFDNAVVNSKVLGKLSRFWQQMFLTVGILIAVFVVRFILPIAIVSLSAGISLTGVVDMALNNPEKYSETLHHSANVINSFGGMFLVMVGLGFFLDKTKKVHWVKGIEHLLAKLGTNEIIKAIIALSIFLVVISIAPLAGQIKPVLIAGAIGIALHVIITLFNSHSEKNQPNGSKILVGSAAFSGFVYLNILDASFSLDGVIGAFAITPDILLIMAGLGIGALWVRSMTIYLVRAGTLAKYKYIEHGAHWAIIALGAIMLGKLYGIEPAEWIIGSLGIILIIASLVSSVRRR